ncbi:MAG: dihydrofolate reductase family protein [Pseudonocardiales bacterium]|nr:dihydrofolate reductase family protein [Pseudonocardiales bacterium]MBV9731085.1 dihydrofolate reductase family protein [Pseudonocardiales bacterium]
MTSRPYVLLSAAMSVDGYIDDMHDARLLLSNEEDLDRVDKVRASVDAILVGANTIRRDNPRLLVRSGERQEERMRRGLAAHPMKVTLTGRGGLDAAARFFSVGDSEKLVYTRNPVVVALRKRLGNVATVIGAGEPIDLGVVLDDLGERKVERLMVEGGGSIHTQFLSKGLVDEIHLVIAPFFVGDAGAARFVHPGGFPQNPEHPMTLAESRRIGNVVLLRYFAPRSDSS